MKQLQTLAQSYDISLDAHQLEQFQIYSDFLREYNEKVNLTAITDPEEIITLHFLDSLLALNAYDIPDGARIIDVGTGAGFPSIPLKIARPDLDLVLLDSLNKRLLFLEALEEKLGTSYEMVHSRAEHMSLEPEFRDSFDIATSRAVAKLSVLTEYCLPYVELGGVFMALKGPEIEEELEQAQRSIEILGGEVIGVHEYALPEGEGRTIVLVEKIESTPKGYPRQGIKIAKTPL